jgi:hypothetical protein
LQCCIPPISEVPVDSFYCFDCSLKGSTAQLEDYFADFDRGRDELLEGDDDDDDDDIAQLLLEEDMDHEFGAAVVPPPPGLPLTELDHSDATTFLGKPLRLYCPNGNLYHSGRIVDVRSCDDDDDDDDDDEKKKDEKKKDEKKKDEKKDDTYCLVRFVAGKDHRKTPLITWLRLEEHCVVVGMKLLWAQFPTAKKEKRRSSKGSTTTSGNKWVRGMLWLRSARELVCVIKDAQGNQILYDTNNNNNNNSDQGGGEDRKQKREWGLVEDVSKLGTDSYSVLRLEQETRETPKQQEQEPKVVSALVQAELAEQRRVRDWNNLPLRNPLHSCAIRGRDEYTLGALEYEVTPRLQIEPSPAIPQGLDRAYILKKLSNQLGVQASKDLASSLVCELVDP